MLTSWNYQLAVVKDKERAECKDPETQDIG